MPKTASTTPKSTDTPAEAVQIRSVASETILVPIRGTSPLIMHKFSEKAKRQMLENMQGVKRTKEKKDPEADFATSLYHIKNNGQPDDHGFPAIAFKAATVGAARFFDKSVTMTSLRQFLFFGGEVGPDGQKMVRIVTPEPPVMREDVVRVGQGTDLRYRGQFNDWTAELEITYVANSITRDSVLSLIDAGGMGVGVGEWRPEKRGDFGTYALDESRDVQVLGGR